MKEDFSREWGPRTWSGDAKKNERSQIFKKFSVGTNSCRALLPTFISYADVIGVVRSSLFSLPSQVTIPCARILKTASFICSSSNLPLSMK